MVLKVSSEYIVNTFEIIAFGKLITKTSISEKLKFYDPHGKRITLSFISNFFLSDSSNMKFLMQFSKQYFKLLLQVLSKYLYITFSLFLEMLARRLPNTLDCDILLLNRTRKSCQDETSKVIVFSLVIFEFPEILFFVIIFSKPVI